MGIALFGAANCKGVSMPRSNCTLTVDTALIPCVSMANTIGRKNKSCKAYHDMRLITRYRKPENDNGVIIIQF